MPGFEEIIRAIRFTGLGNTLRTVNNTRSKERLDRLYRREHFPTGPQKSPGELVEVKSLPGGGLFRFENATLEAVFLAGNLARLSWGPARPPAPYALAKESWPESAPSLQESAQHWTLKGPALHVQLSKAGGITFQDPAGRTLQRQLAPAFKGDEGRPSAWSTRAVLHPEERLYGLGEQAGRLNLRGEVHRMWNSDPGGSYGPGEDPIYTPIPVYMGLHSAGSYLIFYENSFPATFSLGVPNPRSPERPDRSQKTFQVSDQVPDKSSEICQVSFEGGMLRYYFIAGPPAGLLERYTELTGRAPLPPRWSLGYHQCRWGYKSESDIRQVVAGFKEHRLPLSAIHLDIDYMDGYRVFTIHPQRFPDLDKLAHDLLADGIHLVTILDPGVKRDASYWVFRQGMQKDIFCKLPDGEAATGLAWPGWSVFPDFTSPKARTWWGELYSPLLEAGVSGFWHDMNEPASFTAAGDMTLPLAACHDLDGRGGDHLEAHNLYGLLMDRAGYEALRKHRPEKRPWLISRSGWAGLQRYAWNWTGDTESTWQGLRMTIASVLGLGLSGIPFSGPDIGGFSGDPPAELHTRWFQMAAFLPFFRTHSATGTRRREPWVYGEPFTSIMRQFLHLRYRLMPYLYTLAWEAAQTGHPLVRPLFWDEPQDSSLWEVDDAFLLGSGLLVAPILEEKAEQREVLLPRGKWYSFWDDEPVLGPARAIFPANLERIPVLARGGCVLPMQENGRLLLHIYAPNAGAHATSQLYSDAGDGFPASQDDWRIDRFMLARDERSLRLDWDVSGGFPLPYSALEVHLHGIKAPKAVIDGVSAPLEENRIQTGVFRQIRIEV